MSLVVNVLRVTCAVEIYPDSAFAKSLELLTNPPKQNPNPSNPDLISAVTTCSLRNLQ